MKILLLGQILCSLFFDSSTLDLDSLEWFSDLNINITGSQHGKFQANHSLFVQRDNYTANSKNVSLAYIPQLVVPGRKLTLIDYKIEEEGKDATYGKIPVNLNKLLPSSQCFYASNYAMVFFC